MFDLVLILPIIVIVIVSFVLVPILNMAKNRSSSGSTQNHRHATFGRQVDQMHIKDANAERRHRLDQLKSLYEAGMMERDEYEERVECVEMDYAQRRY